MKNLSDIVAALIAFHVILTFAIASFNEAGTIQILDPVINTPLHLIRAGSPFNITAELEGFGQRLAFVLETNRDIITQNTRVQYLDAHGDAGNVDSLADFSYYATKGSVWRQLPGEKWESVGWARLTVIRGGLAPLFEGTFTVLSEQYEIRIQPSNNQPLGGHITAYQVERSNATGIAHGELSMGKSGCKATPGSSFSKRQYERYDSLIDTIGSTSGCPYTKQVAYIGIATDCSYRAAFDSVDAVRRHVINMVNTASVVFENSFNIALGIRDLHIVDAGCSSSATNTLEWNAGCSVGDLNWRLNRFSSWRASVKDDNAYWTLLTDCFVPAGEVGVSWVGELCNSGPERTYKYGEGIGVNVVGHSDTEWQVFAHESAHTFGAFHDCDSSTCAARFDSTSECCPFSVSTCDADGEYLMSPTSSTTITQFSPCTLGNVCTKIGNGSVNTQCLVNAYEASEDAVILTNGQCGNGIVEPGEACDCGGGSCDNEEAGCCDLMTCQWRGGDGCDRSGGDDDRSVAEIWSEWIGDNRSLFIGLCAGLGGLLVLMVVAIIVLSCRRRRQRQNIATAKERALYGY